MLKDIDAVINRWAGGKHYYLVYNADIIEVEGRSKWNTVEEAERAKDIAQRRSTLNQTHKE